MLMLLIKCEMETICDARRLMDFDIHDNKGTQQPLEGSDLKARPLFLTGVLSR